MYVQCNIETRTRNHYFRGKAIIITYSERVFVALVIQHKKHMPRIMLSSVACLSVCLYHVFPNYIINGITFETELFNIKYVF